MTIQDPAISALTKRIAALEAQYTAIMTLLKSLEQRVR